jgi:NADH:ubiquinone oxidoreductase subunit C
VGLAPSELAARLQDRFGDAVLGWEENFGEAVVRLRPEVLPEVGAYLKGEPELSFDFFDFLTAVDREEEGFELVVEVASLRLGHRLRLKALLPRDDPRAPSLTRVWAGANWHERETAEMFGITFEGHPNLAKLLLPEEFEGYPLRKEFTLAAREAKPWPGAKEPGGHE